MSPGPMPTFAEPNARDAREALDLISGTITGRMAPATHDILARQLRFVAATAHSSVPQIVLVVFALGASFLLWGTPETVALWLGAALLSLVLVRRAAAAARAAPAGQALRHTRLLCGAWLAFISVYAAAPLLFWVPGEPVNHILLYTIVLTQIASSSAQDSPSPPVFAANILPSVVALSIAPYVHHPIIEAALLHLLVLVFSTFMCAQGVGTYALVRRLLTLADDKERLIGALSQARDSAESARIRAEHANAAKSEFLAHMSHELRTPLNAILGFSDAIRLQMMGAVSPHYLGYAGHIHESGQHLLSLINDILDLSKIEAGHYAPDRQAVQTATVLHEIAHMFAPQARAAGLRLTCQLAPDLPDLFADARALRQMVLNLVANALKFTPPGGEIVVSARLNEGGGLDISVRDTGIGIAEEDHARVFEPFGQARGPVTLAQSGTGLGLPIVKGLIAAHGGSVHLMSAPGAGTTVTLHFPADCILVSAAA